MALEVLFLSARSMAVLNEIGFSWAPRLATAQPVSAARQRIVRKFNFILATCMECVVILAGNTQQSILRRFVAGSQGQAGPVFISGSRFVALVFQQLSQIEMSLKSGA